MKKYFGILCIFLLIPCFLSAQDLREKEQPPLGIIFNVGNILEGIDSYQGGIGLKYHKEKINYRFLFDMYYDIQSDFFNTSLGLAIEYHFLDDIISPYLGGEIKSGYIYQKDEIDSDNWEKNTTFPLNINSIVGVELYVKEYISFFAEYSIGFEYNSTETVTSTNGTEQTSDESNYIINTGLGNSGKIGVTIYFTNVKNMGKR